MARRSRSAPSSTDDPVDPTREGPPNADETQSPDQRRGVRARLAIRDPPTAPVADALPDGVVATDVERIRVDDTIVSEFRTTRPIDGDPVFAADGEYVYRIRTPTADGEYPCRAVESLGHPVSDVTVRTNPDRILVSLSLPTVEPIGGIVDAIESAGGSVTLERLTRSGGSETGDPVVVDRDRLTDRQREVVRTAHRLGYFEYPREADAAEVAATIGIARSTFAEHLAAAQKRVFDALVDP
ncbi:helix-turn-helix domain-containing protein [Halorubrum sp. DTA46]|uniref:helix-turn-helix domain-containing protein n=1 Tax=Halorubrum sp. DTA46 TaxID=3402162 RepID=UPI003AABBBCF